MQRVGGRREHEESPHDHLWAVPVRWAVLGPEGMLEAASRYTAVDVCRQLSRTRIYTPELAKPA